MRRKQSTRLLWTMTFKLCSIRYVRCNCHAWSHFFSYQIQPTMQGFVDERQLRELSLKRGLCIAQGIEPGTRGQMQRCRTGEGIHKARNNTCSPSALAETLFLLVNSTDGWIIAPLGNRTPANHVKESFTWEWAIHSNHIQWALNVVWVLLRFVLLFAIRPTAYPIRCSAVNVAASSTLKELVR